MSTDIRAGESRLDRDPAEADDARLAFIGRIRTPWSPGDCPRNLRQARERGGAFRLELAPEYRSGLAYLAVGQPIIVLYWMDRGRRDLIVQAPAHADGPRGVFALRSPVRPNPIAVATARIVALDAAAGQVEIDAIDCFDETPLLDIKPWIETVDQPPAAN